MNMIETQLQLIFLLMFRVASQEVSRITQATLYFRDQPLQAVEVRLPGQLAILKFVVIHNCAVSRRPERPAHSVEQDFAAASLLFPRARLPGIPLALNSR